MGVEGEFNYYISLSDSTVSASVSQNNVGTVSVDSTFTGSVWHHAVLTYDGSNVSFYLDGTHVGNKVNTYYPQNHATTNLVLGGGGASFIGSLDDIRIYSRVLTTAEIQALYTE